MNKIAGLDPDKSALDTDLKAGADKAGAGEGGKGDFIGEASPGKVQCKCLNCGHKSVSGSMAAKRELRAAAYQ